LRDGGVAVDMDERIEALNQAMERLLGAPAHEMLGRRLGDLAPDLSLRNTLRETRTELDTIERLNGKPLVTSRMPIVEQGVQTGAVLIAQDPVSIQRVDRHLRARLQPRAAAARYELGQLIGASAAMERAKASAASCARSDATVLIIGESGTGKELLAQGIHSASRRRRQPFVAVNCAAFPEALLESELFGYEEGAFTGSRRGGKTGLFEAAHTGTLFLDEIGEMPVALQTRLLRVLQEREIVRIGATEPTPIDVRVIAATHRDLDARLQSGEFRSDLYYRLNILRLDLPPLRERREDVPALAQHLLQKIAGNRADLRARVSPLVDDLVERAATYAWRGNVRELENFIERLVVDCDQPGADVADGTDRLRDIVPELFAPACESPTLKGNVQDAERRHLLDVLRACQGDRNRACERLGISRTTLWRKLNAAGLATHGN
jgi:propionate catabolism operon transcriptional regulator